MIIIISILLVKLSLVTWVTLSDFAQGIYSGLLCLIKNDEDKTIYKCTCTNKYFLMDQTCLSGNNLMEIPVWRLKISEVTIYPFGLEYWIG